MRKLLILYLLFAAFPSFSMELEELRVHTAGQKPKVVIVERVSQPEALQRGLMFRTSLPENRGMLFDFGLERHISMWMKNTLIPLDMVFIDKGAKIVHIIENTTPETLTPQSTPIPARYVLEVNAGFVKTHNIDTGSEVGGVIVE